MQEHSFYGGAIDSVWDHDTTKAWLAYTKSVSYAIVTPFPNIDSQPNHFKNVILTWYDAEHRRINNEKELSKFVIEAPTVSVAPEPKPLTLTLPTPVPVIEQEEDDSQNFTDVLTSQSPSLTCKAVNVLETVDCTDGLETQSPSDVPSPVESLEDLIEENNLLSGAAVEVNIDSAISLVTPAVIATPATITTPAPVIPVHQAVKVSEPKPVITPVPRNTVAPAPTPTPTKPAMVPNFGNRNDRNRNNNNNNQKSRYVKS